MTLATTTDIIAELRAGRMVVLVDEEDRENEGDLVMAAEFVTAEAINFMARYGRGLICLTLTEERCKQLGLKPMVQNNGTKHGTAFTSSIEAAEGVTTGISAADRARTVQVAVAHYAKAADLVQPGHIFPLTAQPGGVLVRAGHTEAGCDLAQLAGLTPAAVICEILKDDGTMARLPDLVVFAQEHQLKVGTIADLIQYRAANETLVERVEEQPLNSAHGLLQLVTYRDKPSGSAHLAIVKGVIDAEQETLVRVHEPTTILDLLEVSSGTHSWPVQKALAEIAKAPAGVLVLLNCEQNSEQLFNQSRQLRQARDAGKQTRVTEKTARMDLRTYGIGAQILKDLKVGRMRLLSKPRKMPSMAGFELEVSGYVEQQSEQQKNK
jgi:3,4-dihydroxy 2-butanone 4-phosphate synthase / GTP cyclohydrolase II